MNKKILSAVMLIATAIIFIMSPALDNSTIIADPGSPSASVGSGEAAVTTVSSAVTEGTAAPVITDNTTAAAPSETVSSPAETTAETTVSAPEQTTVPAEQTTASETTAAVSETAAETTTAEVTTTAETTPPPTVTMPSGTPVEEHGQLSVKGQHIVDEKGNIYQLRGMSTHGLTWFPDIVSEAAFRTLRDDWNCNAVRLAMYIDEWGNDACYMKNPDQSKALLEKGADIAIDLGMYVILDWHVLNPGNPADYKNQAVKFFDEISKKYSAYPNVIYEICNEPNGWVTWDGVIKPYCEEIIKVIRKNDPDAIIIAGTGTWSQDIHDAEKNRLSDKNVVYALHYYADTHKKDLRDRLQKCYNSGLPVIVSEFGNCDASGGGRNNILEASEWLNMLDELHIGYFNWSLGNKDETCSAFRPGTDLASGNWPDSALTESGKFIKQWYTGR